MQSLSIIIVNYKSASFIVDCLNSASAFPSFNQFEWIVVDNQSNDNSKEIITGSFPNVVWHDMGYNAGFARANNAGMQISKGEYILLLNPDTLILNDAIHVCLQKFATTNDVACGVQMLNKDLTTQISGSRFMKGGLNHLLPLPYWGKMLKWISAGLNVKKPSIEKAAATEKVDWISGAFLMVKKTAIESAGYMDEDFFLYGEEVEWCSRLGKKGSLSIYGEINIIHIMGEVIASNAQSDDKSYTNLFDKKGLQLILSNHVRIRKQYGLFWFFVQLLNYTLAVPVFFIASFLEHLIQFQNPFKDFGKAAGLASNVLAVWRHCYTIIQNKPHFYKVL